MTLAIRDHGGTDPHRGPTHAEDIGADPHIRDGPGENRQKLMLSFAPKESEGGDS